MQLHAKLVPSPASLFGSVLDDGLVAATGAADQPTVWLRATRSRYPRGFEQHSQADNAVPNDICGCVRAIIAYCPAWN